MLETKLTKISPQHMSMQCVAELALFTERYRYARTGWLMGSLANVSQAGLEALANQKQVDALTYALINHHSDHSFYIIL